LRRQLTIAEQERDILKKAVACFAKDKNRGFSSSSTTGGRSKWA